MPSQQTTAILSILAEHRRISEDEMESHSVTEFAPKAIDTIDAMIAKGDKIRIVMTGFPEKCPVRKKTLSDLPDMAERVSLGYLNELCEQIKSVYAPGAELVIYSDAFAFADVFPDSHTQEKRNTYLTKLANMIEESHAGNIKIINLAGTVDLNAYAETNEHFEARMKDPKTEADKNTLTLYRGQIRFFTTELSMGYPDMSPSQVKKKAGVVAKGVARMSDALSKYISTIEPQAIRVSCHPKTVATDKLGIWLDEHHSAGGTPWHNAVVFGVEPSTLKCSTSFMKAEEARQHGYILETDKEGNPSHFVTRMIHHDACIIQSFFKQHKPTVNSQQSPHTAIGNSVI